jgi:hypothetical protein
MSNIINSALLVFMNSFVDSFKENALDNESFESEDIIEYNKDYLY